MDKLVIKTLADIEIFEQTPIEDRMTCFNTYDLIKQGADINPDAIAMSFIMSGDAFEEPMQVTYKEFIQQINRTANLFHDLGVGSTDVISYLLPNIPHTHYVLWGGEAAGIVNPINPLLEPATIRDICLAADTKVMVALGSCAHLGGIPGMANEFSREEIFHRAYLENPSLEEGNVGLPVAEKKVAAGTLEIPHFHRAVRRLSDVVEVDYFIPGCPPAPEQIKAVLLAVATGKLPPAGSVVGASDRALCDECGRRKDEKKVTRFHRPWQIIQDPDRCLLEQGIVCAGSVTRAGCGVRCPDSGMPCRGCYGPTAGVCDQGAKLVSAVASIVAARSTNRTISQRNRRMTRPLAVWNQVRDDAKRSRSRDGLSPWPTFSTR